MKVIITGASGFLGRALIKKLENDESLSLIALTSFTEELKAEIKGNVEVFDRDILYRSEAREVFRDAVVINCAFPRNSTGTGMANGLAYIRTLFEISKACIAKAVINISSQSVYSPGRQGPADEETELSLESTYAVGKYASELLCSSILVESRTVYTNLRMASLIGPGFDQRITNRLVKQAFSEGRFFVKENGQRFGFLDIEDAVSGIERVLKTNFSLWKHVYNLGAKGAYSLVDIANAVAEVMKEYGRDIVFDVEKGEESGSSELNIERFCEDFGFRPSISLTESIRRIARDKAVSAE